MVGFSYEVVRLPAFDETEESLPLAVRVQQSGDIVAAGAVMIESGTKTAACRWDHGIPKRLEGLEQYRYSVAKDVNIDGVIVGRCSDFIANEKQVRAVRWNVDGSLDELPPLPGHDSSEANSVNKNGVVAGMSFHSDVPTEKRAVLWFDCTVAELRVPEAGFLSSQANAVNDDMLFVGAVSTSDASGMMAFWRANNAMLALPDGWPTAGVLSVSNKSTALVYATRKTGSTVGVMQLDYQPEVADAVFATKQATITAPYTSVASDPVFEHSDRIRIVANFKHSEGVEAGVPVPLLYEADSLEVLEMTAPISINTMLELPAPWDQLNIVRAMERGGILVGTGLFRKVETGILLVPT